MLKIAAKSKRPDAIQTSLFDIKQPLIPHGSAKSKVLYTRQQQVKNPYLGMDLTDPASVRKHIAYSEFLEQQAKPKINALAQLEKLRALVKKASHSVDITTKPKYKVIKSDVDYNDNTKVLQPKVDGASAVIHLNTNKDNVVYSPRISKRSGGVIDHTNQVPDIRDLDVPKKFDNTVLRGELFAKTDHKPLPAERIGGILNAGVEKSLKLQKEHGKLRPYIYDIIRFNGEDVSGDSYQSKLDMLKRVEAAIPQLRVADTAFSSESKKKLVEAIKNRKHPDTEEGVVEWDLHSPTGKPAKLKFRDNWDVYIRNIFQARDKHGKAKEEAGGFVYSWSDKGPGVGRVGTGFDSETRRDMWKNPQKYEGKVARVKSPHKYDSGALRAPAFYTMDIEKNLEQVKTAAYHDELAKIATPTYGAIEKAISMRRKLPYKVQGVHESMRETPVISKDRAFVKSQMSWVQRDYPKKRPGIVDKATSAIRGMTRSIRSALSPQQVKLASYEQIKTDAFIDELNKLAEYNGLTKEAYLGMLARMLTRSGIGNAAKAALKGAGNFIANKVKPAVKAVLSKRKPSVNTASNVVSESSSQASRSGMGLGETALNVGLGGLSIRGAMRAPENQILPQGF